MRFFLLFFMLIKTNFFLRSIRSNLQSVIDCYVTLKLDFLKYGCLKYVQLPFDMLFIPFFFLPSLQLSHCMIIREPMRKQRKKDKHRTWICLIMQFSKF